MAVNITVAALAAAIRVGDSAAEIAEVTRLREYAIAAIARHLGDAYETADVAALNESAVRLVAYIYDQPQVSRGAGFSDAMRFSGCARMLLPFKVHRLGRADVRFA